MRRARLSPTLCLVALLAACGGKEPAPAAPEPPASEPPDERTEIERRRDAACEALAPRLTACALEDARRTMTPDEVANHERETAPVHTRKFVEACQAQQLSSRQVRVYEVCLREETECEPLVACLDNARPKDAAAD